MTKTHSHARRRLLARSAVTVALTAVGLLAAAPAAIAQGYPNKPVKVIVNFPPGGAADQIARAVTTPLSEVMGQTFVVENRAGAGGNIGGDAAARSPADGYTLLMSSGGMVSINPAIYPKMSFDPTKDITPVAAAARILVFLEVKPSLPVKDVKEFISYLKTHPDKLTYSSPGNGSSPHLAGELFMQQAGTKALHIPYRGAAPAMQDLLGGQVDFMFDPGIGLQHVKAGKLKMLAVGSMQRSTLFPDVPTLDEAGLKGFNADTYFGFYAPTGTPPEIITRLNTEINKIVSSPAFKERMASLGAEPSPMTPAQFSEKAHEDTARFGQLIKDRHIMGG